MFRKRKNAKVVELLPRGDGPPYAESVPLRLSATRAELDRLRKVVDNWRIPESEAREASRGLHFIAMRLLDALSGVDDGD